MSVAGSGTGSGTGTGDGDGDGDSDIDGDGDGEVAKQLALNLAHENHRQENSQRGS